MGDAEELVRGAEEEGEGGEGMTPTLETPHPSPPP